MKHISMDLSSDDKCLIDIQISHGAQEIEVTP